MGRKDEEREFEILKKFWNVVGIFWGYFFVFWRVCDGDRSVITGYRLTASTAQWGSGLGLMGFIIGPLDPRLCPIFLVNL